MWQPCQLLYTCYLPRDAMLARYVLLLCVCVCLYVSLSITNRSSILKRLNESSWFLAWGFFPPLLTASLENSGTCRISALPSGTLSRTLDFDNFAAASRVDRVVNKTCGRSSLLTTLATVDASWLDRRCYTFTAHISYCTSVDRNIIIITTTMFVVRSS